MREVVQFYRKHVKVIVNF